MTPDKLRRPFGLGVFVALLIGVGLVAMVAGVVGGVVEQQTGASGFWVTVVSLGLAMAVCIALSLWWWRNIDEAAREAHKWAWWWGGSGGMAVGAVFLLSLRLSADSPVDLGQMSAEDLISGGMVAILLFQTIGYAIAWAFWWLRHR